MNNLDHIARKKICSTCGSDDLVFDAYARWNPLRDMFELDEVFDFTYCNNCNGETTAKDIEINDK